MTSTRLFASVTGVVVVVILTLALFSTTGLSPKSTTSTGPSGTGAFTAAAENVTAVYTETMVRAPTTSASSSASTTSSAGSTTATSSSTSAVGSGDGGSYTYTPSSEVQVLAVSAEVDANQTGGGTVVFVVQFKNIGTGSIYVAHGGGSGLAVNVTSGGSILHQVRTLKCLIVTAMVPVAPGAASEAMAPGCWSGYQYELVGPGTVGTEMVLTWTRGSAQGGGEGSITITADFTLS